LFSEFMGLPLHPLVVHAVVIFVPLLVLAGLAYAFVPRWRRQVGWLALVLSVAAPIVAFVARQSGGALEEVLVAKNYAPEILDQVAQHQEYGDLTFWFTLGLALFTAALVLATGGHPRAAALPWWIRPALMAGVGVFGVLSGVYVYLAGESGAEAVWTGVM
jgi:hypothetical protein